MKNVANLDFHTIELVGRDGRTSRYAAALLGDASSRRDEHTHDRERDPYVPPGGRCSACRWFEVDIYRTDAGTYVVHTVGASVVPGERRRSRVTETTSAYEVIELLTVRPYGKEPFITAQSAGALAQAAELDDDVRDAYINRAVV